MFVCKIDQSHLNKNILDGSSFFRKSQQMNGRDETVDKRRYERYHKSANILPHCKKSSKLDGAMSFK